MPFNYKDLMDPITGPMVLRDIYKKLDRLEWMVNINLIMNVIMLIYLAVVVFR